MNDGKQIITRMAPSPTGLFHVGSLRTTVFNYLFARQNKGKFILRIEDTDQERSKPEYEQNILSSLEWLDINHDDFYRQSERTDIYKEKLQYLIDSNLAYEAEENKDGTGKVIRFKNPNTKIAFTDIILGDMEFETEELGDFVIARSLDNPLYHLTVVVDDGEMNVSHVIRGQDHISNTPRQILLLEALGYERPEYAHIPLILAQDKSKLSKRHGAVAVTEYQKQGYTRDALFNFMALLGWHPSQDEQEIFSREELVKEFNLEKVQKGGAIFNIEKLNWINKEWLSKMSEDDFIQYLGSVWQDFSVRNEAQNVFLELLRERINKRADIEQMMDEGEFAYLSDSLSYAPESLVWKKSDKDSTIKHLHRIHDELKKIEQWNIDNVKSSIWDYAEQEGKGNVLWPLRYSLSGRDRSPDPFTLAFLLGQEKTLERISQAVGSLV